MKTVETEFGIIEADDTATAEDIQKAIDKRKKDLEARDPIKQQKDHIDSLKAEVRACSDESTKALLAAQESHCEKICKTIEANKPKDPIKYKSFRATKIAEGDFKVVLEAD